MHLTRLNMKGIQTKLPSDEFIRIYRSYIIAFSKITTFQKDQDKIAAYPFGEKEISIGESYRENLFRKIG